MAGFKLNIQNETTILLKISKITFHLIKFSLLLLCLYCFNVLLCLKYNVLRMLKQIFLKNYLIFLVSDSSKHSDSSITLGNGY